jgi:hypothetical protein
VSITAKYRNALDPYGPVGGLIAALMPAEVGTAVPRFPSIADLMIGWAVTPVVARLAEAVRGGATVVRKDFRVALEGIAGPKDTTITPWDAIERIELRPGHVKVRPIAGKARKYDNYRDGSGYAVLCRVLVALGVNASFEPRGWAESSKLWQQSAVTELKCSLRATLNLAVREELIGANPARHIEIHGHRRPHAQVWTEGRVEAWERDGEHPSVAVWTAKQLAALRRGEVCGLRWAAVALDKHTVAILRAHRSRQLAHRDKRHGNNQVWIDSGYVFTRKDGEPINPS